MADSTHYNTTTQGATPPAVLRGGRSSTFDLNNQKMHNSGANPPPDRDGIFMDNSLSEGFPAGSDA